MNCEDVCRILYRYYRVSSSDNVNILFARKHVFNDSGNVECERCYQYLKKVTDRRQQLYFG